MGSRFDLAALIAVAVYACGASGVIVDFNRRAAQLWGRKPTLRDICERFCGSFEFSARMAVTAGMTFAKAGRSACSDVAAARSMHLGVNHAHLC